MWLENPLLTVIWLIFENPRYTFVWLLMYTEKVLIYPMKTSGFDEISLCNDMDWISQFGSIKGVFGIICLWWLSESLLLMLVAIRYIKFFEGWQPFKPIIYSYKSQESTNWTTIWSLWWFYLPHSPILFKCCLLLFISCSCIIL